MSSSKVLYRGTRLHVNDALLSIRRARRPLTWWSLQRETEGNYGRRKLEQTLEALLEVGLIRHHGFDNRGRAAFVAAPPPGPHDEEFPDIVDRLTDAETAYYRLAAEVSAADKFRRVT